MPCLDQDKSFSKSMIWDLQREYFSSQGVSAWDHAVPYFATCNPFIANSYAQIYLAFVEDWLAAHPEDQGKEFYLLELGCGHGKFAFHFVKRLIELQAARPDLNCKFCYVMSDYAESNIDFWEKHPAIKPFVASGIVDFACVNLESDTDVSLIKRNKKLSAALAGTPLVAIANYLFDSISHDCFYVDKAEIYEVLVSLHSPDNNQEGERIKDWTRLSLTHDKKKINGSYYEDPNFDKVVQSYQHEFDDTYFLIPTAGLRALKQLINISNNKFVIITSDKAYSDAESLKGGRFPYLSFQGTFSMMVNYHAMARYFEVIGGHVLVQTPRKGIKTVLFASSGANFANSHRARQAAYEYIELFSPADYFQLHRQAKTLYKSYDIAAIAAHLELSRWDPHIYDTFREYIIEKLSTADKLTYLKLVRNLKLLVNEFYYMPGAADPGFSLGVFYHKIRDYQTAISCYNKSLEYFGESRNTLFNLAVCYFELQKNHEVLKLTKRCLELDPSFEAAQDLQKRIGETNG